MLKQLVAICILARLVIAQGITRPFLNRTDINDKAFNAYGTIEGRTSWVRAGFGPDAELDLTLEFTITNSPNSAFNAINDYQITVFLSQNETSGNADYLKVESVGLGSSVRDAVNVGTYTALGWADLNQKVGQSIPSLNSGISSYSYRVSETSAFTSSSPSARLWSLDTKQSRRITSSTPNKLELVFKRSRSQPGVANIFPGASVKGRVFVSPAGSTKIYNAFDVAPQWSREFSGSGVGSIPGKRTILAESDQAVLTASASATFLGLASIFLWL